MMIRFPADDASPSALQSTTGETDIMSLNQVTRLIRIRTVLPAGIRRR